MRGGGGIRAGVSQQTPAAALGLSRSELERQRLYVRERERERERQCAHVITRRNARPVPQRT